MAMMNRSALDASAALAFTAIEIGLLDKLVVDKH
jgi:PIN domain nuclease of toxin-antitoxin system